MYNYDFIKKEEKVLFEKTNCYVEIDDYSYNLNVLVTNKNILLFYNSLKNSALKASGIEEVPQYYLELAIPLNNLEYSIEDGNTFIEFNNSDILLNDVDISKINIK